MPIKPAAPVTRTFIATAPALSPASRLFERAQLGVLAEAVEAADGDVHEARRAIEEAAAQNVETQESDRRREHEPDERKALAARMHRFRLERGVPVLLVE